jgi:predicted AlkP superfamily pyrophosphatase or phosphodiesterase
MTTTLCFRARLTVLITLAVMLGALGVPGATLAQSARPTLIMISIDGLRPDYVTAADTHGLKIPNLRRFLKEGAFADGVTGVIPTVTYPSHTTLITGVWPTKHRILANTTFDPLGKNQSGWYWYAEDIKVPTLWDVARQAGMTTASIQWPVSVGARVTWNIPEVWRANTDDDAKLLRALATDGLLPELEPELGPYPRGQDVADDERRGTYAVRVIEKKRPQLLTLHLLALDHIEHETGPLSPESFAVLERQDAVVGKLRDAVERLAPGHAYVAIVSDHGFVNIRRRMNPFVAFRNAGLITVSGRAVTAWKAMPWTAGGSAAIVLKDPADAATAAEVRGLLDKLAADPANGIDRVLGADELHAHGGFPDASFLIGCKPGWMIGSGYEGAVITKTNVSGTHGHLPDLPELRAAFFLVGPGVPAGRSLGLVDMRDIAPTLAQRLGLALPAAEGKPLLR